MIKKETYFDTGVYQGKIENCRVDLTTLVLENAEDKLEKRITPYEMKFDAVGQPNFAIRQETETDKKENEALFKIRDRALEGKKYMLWISPPSDEIGYKESRFVAAIVKKKNEDGSLEFDCRGWCAKFGSEECLEIAKKMGVTPKEAEDLRSEAIVLDELEGEDWIDKLEKIIEMPEVWKAIKSGEDKINRRQKEEIVNEVVSLFESRLSRQMNYRQRLILGRDIEDELMRRNVNLQKVGSCGMSNSETLKAMNTFGVVFDNSLVPGVKPEGYDYFCKPCGCWCRGETCPICGLKLSMSAAA